MEKKSLIFILLALGSLLSSCSQDITNGTTNIWIDVPLDGLTIPAGQPVQVEGHVSHPGGISKIEIYINGQLFETLQNQTMAGSLSSFVYLFNPPETGDYAIQVVAYSNDGTPSLPDATRIRVRHQVEELKVETPRLVISPTLMLAPTATFTPDPFPVPEAVVLFRGEPAEIDAGKCSRLLWHVENVQSVVFGGVNQAFDGSYDVCLCETQYYPLIVTYLDGSSEKFTVEVKVNGVCATPVPDDTTPPPVPSLEVPANGTSIGCKAAQSLTWMPVQDPNGISNYQIQVQRHSGDSNWQEVSGSVFSSADKTIDIPVECGWYYRWRVRAVDGKGNRSDWSGWFQFTITLS